MKEKILSFFPYFLIIICFTAIISINGKITAAETQYAFKETEKPPQISVVEKNESTKEESSTSATVEEIPCYFTKSGKKYHLDRNCRYIKNNSTISQTDVSSAIKTGLEPCTNCAE